MSDYWIISDTHFGHDTLIRVGVRPKDYEMKITNFINNTLHQDDILIHLGDVSWSDHAHYNKMFTSLGYGCKKILCLGNHDTNTVKWYYTYGWNCITNNIELDIYGHKIMFSHRPLPESMGYTLNIHGHFHGYDDETILKHDPELSALRNDKQYLFALEHTNYQAMKLSTIVKEFNRK